MAEFFPIELNGKQQTKDFELNVAKRIKAQILLPGGKPAANAQVQLGGISDFAVRIDNGMLVDGLGNPETQADENGRFEMTNPNVPFVIVAVHPDGFVYATQAEVETGSIQMIPWARIEGTIMNGRKPAVNVDYHCFYQHYGAEVNGINRLGLPRSLSYEGDSFSSSSPSYTDKDGKFVIERVPPNLYGIVSQSLEFGGPDGVMDHYGKRSSHYAPIFTQSGETVKVQIGGKGRPIKGTLVLQGELAKSQPWKHSLLVCRRIKESQKPEARMKEEFEVSMIPNEQGRFQINDVIPGKYEIRFEVYLPIKPPKNSSRREEYSYSSEKAVFEVPPMDGDFDDTPLDVGEIIIEPKKE